jgi:Na+/proline symporter
MRKGVGKKAYILAGLLWLPVPIVAGFLGLAAPALDIAIPRPDMVGPVIAATILGYAGAILVFVVVFCSLASSIDSLLAATSDLVTKDLVQPLFMPDADQKQLRSVSTWVVVAVGLLTWLLCLPKMGTLASVLFFAGPMVASTIWPILYGLYRRDANAKGAVAAMLGGTIVGLLAYFILGWYTASLIGTAVSFTLLVTITKFAPSRFDWRKLDARPEEAMEVS